MKLSFEIDDNEATNFVELIACKVAEKIAPNESINSYDDGFMSIKEAAKFLCVTVAWIYNNHEKEEIPCYKIGKLKFNKKELIKWTKTRLKV